MSKWLSDVLESRLTWRVLVGILLVVAISGCMGDAPCTPDGSGGFTVCGDNTNPITGCTNDVGGGRCHTDMACTCQTVDGTETGTVVCKCKK